MSNRTGDRYTCTDSNCGCEIEIKNPCSMVESTPIRTHDEEIRGESDPVLDPATMSAPYESQEEKSLRRASGAVSTPGDYGSQGATGEGVFGTPGRGESAMMSGRYASSMPRHMHETEKTQKARSSAPTCFCGNPMREIGSQARTTSAGRARS